MGLHGATEDPIPGLGVGPLHLLRYSTAGVGLRRATEGEAARLENFSTVALRKRLAMVHDYNLPIGPWGQEQTQEQLKEQRALCENFELFCASQHLTAPRHLSK